jgi:ABC-type uncharacterized transport system involved in gliding motility auxiliary subunit
MHTATLALVGLASVLFGFVFRLLAPGLRAYAWCVLAVGAVLLAVAAVADRRRVQGALSSPRGRYGVGATVRLSLFCGIVVLANAISLGTFHRFDLSSLSQFTLTSQTKEALERLDTPVEAVCFFTPSLSTTVSGYAGNLLAEYQQHSRLITVREIDPEMSPDLARQYQVDQFGALYGVIVFKGVKGQRQVFGPQISAEAEHAFTSAILEVTGARQKRVYFLTGHGEEDICSGYDKARSGLLDNLFQVGELDLLRASAVPTDAAAIIVAGPRQPLAAAELLTLRGYLRDGGRVFLLLDPGAPRDLRELVGEWGLDFVDGTIIDPTSCVMPNRDSPLVTESRNHFGLSQVYFPGTAGVLPHAELPANVRILPLAWTSPDGWLQTAPARAGESAFDPRTGRKGPWAMGALISTVSAEGTGASGETRLAVMADSDFASSRHFLNGDNGDFFLSVVSWLVEGKDLVSVDRKVLPTRKLILAPEQARFLFITSIGLLPLLLLLAGGFLAWRRRRG